VAGAFDAQLLLVAQRGGASRRPEEAGEGALADADETSEAGHGWSVVGRQQV
jgi:hypothetical protein